MRWWWVLVTWSLVLLSSTAAAKLEVTVDMPEGPIKPDTEVRSFSVGVMMPCEDRGPASSTYQATLTAELDFTGVPDGVTIAGSPRVNLGNQCFASGTIEGAASFTLTASRDVVGLTPLAIDVKATVDAGPVAAVSPAQEATAQVPFVVDYSPNMQLKLAQKVLEGTPGSTLEFFAELTNLGNAATEVVPKLLDPAAPGFVASVPEPFVVERGATVRVPVRVQLPNEDGWNNQEAQIRVQWEPRAAQDVTLVGNLLDLHLLARVRGNGGDGGVASPMPVMPLVAVALLGAALLQRVRRNA